MTTYERDAALYELIGKHGIRPVVFDIPPEEWTSLAAYFAELFKVPVPETKHAPLFRAIKQSAGK